jgi:flagellar hook protein FlgE
MMRSLYAGVSGLQNHQIRMDVIGNNIANVNTYGFKRNRVTFQDMISQTMSGASKPNEEVGGINAKQIGLGMMVATIDTIHTQGNLQTTGVVTDLALQGNGFFVLKDGDKSFYTRAGNFDVDREGTFVNKANGMRVQGWMAQEVDGKLVINTAATTSDLKIPVGSKDPAKETTQAWMACNLDKRSDAWQSDLKIFDSTGVQHTLRIQFTKSPEQPNQWRAVATVDPDAVTPTQTLVNVGAAGNAANAFTINFDNYGAISSVVDEQGDEMNTGLLNLNVSYLVPDTNPDAEGNPVRQNIQLNLGQIGDFKAAVTQQAESSSTKFYEQNGYGQGYLETFKIDQAGMITAVYSNGSNRTIGQIALASFTNNGGLEKEGDNMFKVSNNSGMANISEAGIAGKGKFLAGTLEMSNVDLSDAFTDMIVTQRGFQANSKTITTSDEMLQELLTLKR